MERDEPVRSQLAQVELDRLARQQVDRDRVGAEGVEHDQVVGPVRRGGELQAPVAYDDLDGGPRIPQVREVARVRRDAGDRRVELVEGVAVAGPAVGGERAAPEADGADGVEVRPELAEDLSDRALTRVVAERHV